MNADFPVILIILFELLMINADFPKIINHGTNIHFTNPAPGVSNEMAQAYTRIRMDFSWQGTEPQKGVYNFAAYDTLYNSLSASKMLPYFILDYGNPLYDGGNSPVSPEAVQAFTNWAIASLTHFNGKGIIWELWNEPNIGFWKPTPNATQYANLANAVGKGIRDNALIKNEVFVGPATANIDFNFIEAIFKLGVLQYFDAVSTHPYRCGCPETATADYLHINNLINQYNPNKNKYIPIISSEWGWPTCLNSNTGQPMQCIGWNCNEVVTFERQAQWLSRQWLIDDMNNVTISIFYDWMDDGADITQREQNFGTVGNKYYNSSLPYIPKLAFNAAKAYKNMVEKNNFMGFTQYLPASSISCANCQVNQVKIFRFGTDLSANNLVNLAVWYSIDCQNIDEYNTGIDVTVNIGMGKDGCWSGYDLYGNSKGQLCTSNNGASVLIKGVSQSPMYFFDFK